MKMMKMMYHPPAGGFVESDNSFGYVIMAIKP
jgi:hypothetical protein